MATIKLLYEIRYEIGYILLVATIILLMFAGKAY